MLAWVGLGADGLSSSSYGPDEAFRQLAGKGHDFTSLAVGLAIATAVTVFIISYAYSRIIEHFPSGGGGYVVATKLLGPRFGVLSGSALLVDYVLTITTSVASGGDALFNMVPREWFGEAAMHLAEGDIGTWVDPVQRLKVGVELAATLTLTVLNIRGARESVTAVMPLFAVFVLTHAVVLLLFVAAQTGFVDGPRVMANMAVDSWLPHRFAALSERLSMQNGVLIMGATSVAALLYTHGDVARLVVMYSINVFLTFSLSEFGMSRFWIRHRKEHPDWYKHLPVHLTGLTLCLTILVVTCFEKFGDGGWLTLVITGLLVAGCFAIKRHYRQVADAIGRLDLELPDPLPAIPDDQIPKLSMDPKKPIAILFVGRYGGLGRHALMTMLRMFPGHFKGVVFCSIAIIDSGNFKGVDEVHELERRTVAELEKYVKFAATIDVPAEYVLATGMEVPEEAEKIGTTQILRFPRGLFIAGQILFDEDSTWRRILHNETAFLIQRRFQNAGIPMIVLPVRLRLTEGPRLVAPSMTTPPEPA